MEVEGTGRKAEKGRNVHAVRKARSDRRKKEACADATRQIQALTFRHSRQVGAERCGLYQQAHSGM
jgi:hypothetical protein